MHRQPVETTENLIEEMGGRLHELCQPLTALQCRLELGLMECEPHILHAAIEEALKECDRMNKRVHAMQFALRGARSHN